MGQCSGMTPDEGPGLALERSDPDLSAAVLADGAVDRHAALGPTGARAIGEHGVAGLATGPGRSDDLGYGVLAGVEPHHSVERTEAPKGARVGIRDGDGMSCGADPNPRPTVDHAIARAGVPNLDTGDDRAAREAVEVAAGHMDRRTRWDLRSARRGCRVHGRRGNESSENGNGGDAHAHLEQSLRLPRMRIKRPGVSSLAWPSVSADP
jgi:hypothetical protein